MCPDTASVALMRLDVEVAAPRSSSSEDSFEWEDDSAMYV
jgi:hypothetical protein